MARATFAGVGMALLGATAIYTGAKIPQPFLILHQQEHEIAALRQRDRTLANKERSLLVGLNYYHSHDGKTQLRHEQGTLQPGERYVRLLPADKFGPQASAGSAPEPQRGAAARLRGAARRMGRWVRQTWLRR